MLKKNRFLFEQHRGLDKKTWSGMWRSPFVLQTFAHHFNFIQGCIEIPQLNGKLGATALALAAAAVCRTLTLVANNIMTFHSVVSADTWTAIIPKGGHYEFNETVWGETTRRYLEPIEALSDEQLELIVEGAQKYVKKGKGKGVTRMSSTDSADEAEGEFDDLFAFC
ncbi:hypothetical protein PAXINDRAFT_16670 [Paxillus involutus ATCC 200175]|uniref:Uncharacterized protein n=1 Tax=Paxillus involutus ATCC 200175 TaxID=664439 RepID=A0A0C9THT2_PAXIN|nr:hypothetical protein PAXINDRAFT_16670 [Paxillus involutus ATCC 200175]